MKNGAEKHLPDDWRERIEKLPDKIGYKTVAEVLGVTDTFVSDLRAKKGLFKQLTDRLSRRRGPGVQKSPPQSAPKRVPIIRECDSLEELLDLISDTELAIRENDGRLFMAEKKRLRALLLQCYDVLYDQSKNILHLQREFNAAKEKFAREKGAHGAKAHSCAPGRASTVI